MTAFAYHLPVPLILLAGLGLSACATEGPAAPRAQLNSETGCYVSIDKVSCRRAHDLAGGYPITALDD